jgi:hypothetical protein
MRIELKAGALRIGPHQTLKVTDAVGTTVSAIEGSVWITEENEPRDIVLAAGSSYRLKRRGVAVINALGSVAALAFN